MTNKTYTMTKEEVFKLHDLVFEFGIDIYGKLNEEQKKAFLEINAIVKKMEKEVQ